MRQPRDPWNEPAPDPNEVTVQLDSAPDPSGGAPAPSASDSPVFVDASGRRSRRFRRIGLFVGVACAVYAAVIVVTLMSGNSSAPWLPVPGQGGGKPAGKVDPSPSPSGSAKRSGDEAAPVVPGAAPTVDATSSAPPGAKASASPKASKSASPKASTSPKPSASKTTKAPGSGSGVTQPTTPATTATTPAANQSSTPATSTPTPTESTGGSGNGSGTVANGGSDPAPLATTSAAATPTGSLA
ncbi:hypothetical protein [Streptomyces mangrovisoli]|uniref:hypothetical protein n=1 Tax=Streptomyces mangrovisoli TaxID=1428628 RepID=UPI001160B87C|nr:hypothetical protein [Streptomyces mangrovisoli]